VLFGRPRFLPGVLSSMVVRAAIFVAFLGYTISVVKAGEAAMKKADPAQGPNFLPVNKLTTTGPYEHTRNPMYSCMLGIVPASAVLADSLFMGLTMALMPLYLDQYVIPAEEALNKKLFGKQFEAYCAKVPRWLF
jgi:protein-S-isoprenylcysteine O-methyltransferase Ste14